MPKETLKQIAVLSGKGGVGKSTVAYNIALGLHEHGFKVGVLDADVNGPNIPQISGAKKPEVLVDIQNNVLIPIEHEGLELMSIGYAIPDHAPVLWRGIKKIDIIKQIFRYTRWSEDLDFLIIDCPAGTGDELRAVLEEKPDGGIIVTIPHAAANADGLRAKSMLKEYNTPYMGVIINMSYLKIPCPHCNNEILYKKEEINGFTKKEIITSYPDDLTILKTNRLPNREQLINKLLPIIGRNLIKKSKKRMLINKALERTFKRLS